MITKSIAAISLAQESKAMELPLQIQGSRRWTSVYHLKCRQNMQTHTWWLIHSSPQPLPIAIVAPSMQRDPWDCLLSKRRWYPKNLGDVDFLACISFTQFPSTWYSLHCVHRFDPLKTRKLGQAGRTVLLDGQIEKITIMSVGNSCFFFLKKNKHLMLHGQSKSLEQNPYQFKIYFPWKKKMWQYISVVEKKMWHYIY